MRRRALVLVTLAAGLVLVVSAIVLALPSLLDLPRFQALLRAEASRLLDRPVRFERVSLGYWPLPAVRIRGLTVANGPGFGPDPLLAVDDARIRVRLLPLLRGRLQFGEVTLEKPRVILEQRRDGSWNLPGPGSSRPAPAASLILVSRVRLREGHVEIRMPGESGAGPSAHLVDRIDVALEDLGWSDPIRFQIAARLPGGGLVVTVDGQVGPLAGAGADLAALPARLTARFTAEEGRPGTDAGVGLSGRGEGEIRAEGPLGNLRGGGRLRFARLVVAARPAACAGRLARPLVLEGVELPVQIAGPRLAIEPFALRVGGGTARGGAVLTLQGGVPAIRLADVRLQSVAAEPILVDFLCQPYAVTGRLDATGEGSFAGTGSDLLRSARGTWQIQVGPGRLVGPAIVTLLAGAVRVGSALSAAVSPGSPLPASPDFDSLTAAGGVGGGQVQVRQFAVQNRQVRLTGSGTYGLLDTRLDFDLQVRAGRSSFGVKLAGTAREPSYQLASRGLAKGLAEILGGFLSSGRKPEGR
jgi:uncharacterized protein involved in outer membrane biogenesis